MSALENFTGKFKHFKPTTWSIKNKTSIYLFMLVVSAWGIFQFVTLPKEQFPDIVIPTIYVPPSIPEHRQRTWRTWSPGPSKNR